MKRKDAHQLIIHGENEPFIGFYNEHRIIPVTQDVSQPDFIFKRNSLYKLLGLPLPSLRGRTILEFGPGGGYNALAITYYGPKVYVFVDASSASLDELNNKVNAKSFGTVDTEIIASNIFDFEDHRKFDIVIIEGVIPGQRHPHLMLKHASSFVSQGGFLITTTTTAMSLLSEVCRRVFLPHFTSTYKTFEDQVSAAVNMFEPHLSTLETKTRPVRDWVLDSIFNPWETSSRMCFTILDSIVALGDEFEFYGSSPKFLMDDRFYKTIGKNALTSNKLVAEQFPPIAFALIDYRIGILEALKCTASAELEPACMEAYDLHSEMLADDSYDQLDKFLACLQKIEDMIPHPFETTSAAIREFIELFPRFVSSDISHKTFRNFCGWWGRGQQYVSFIRTSTT